MPIKEFHSRVEQTTETSGTGNVTLSVNPVNSSRVTVQSKYAVGRRLPYGIYAVDGSGTETGQWEVGEGTYLGDNLLERTVPQEGSSATLPVDFAPGTKRVTVVITPADLMSATMFGGDISDVVFSNGVPVSWKTAGIPFSVTYETISDGEGKSVQRATSVTIAGVTRTVEYDPETGLPVRYS